MTLPSPPARSSSYRLVRLLRRVLIAKQHLKKAQQQLRAAAPIRR